MDGNPGPLSKTKNINDKQQTRPFQVEMVPTSVCKSSKQEENQSSSPQTVDKNAQIPENIENRTDSDDNTVKYEKSQTLDFEHVVNNYDNDHPIDRCQEDEQSQKNQLIKPLINKEAVKHQSANCNTKEAEPDLSERYKSETWTKLYFDWPNENIKMFDETGHKVATTTYGEIINDNKEIPYVRLAHDTPPIDIYKLIKEHWRHELPIIALSLIGEGDLKTCTNKEASEKIFEGMEKVMTTSRICLISDGTYRLNQRLMDSIPKSSKFMHIGIAHFNSLDIKQCLIGSSQIQVPESTSLNFSHTHLLLVDDGSDTPCNVIDFRSNLESFLFTATNDLTQMVSFATGGKDAYTLEMLAKTIENQIPLFVVKQGNNQNGANYIATIIEQQKNKTVGELDGIGYKQIPKPIKQQLQEKGKVWTHDSVNYLDTFFKKIDSAIQKVKSLQQITLIDGNEDVDKLFLEAITENAVSEIDKRTVTTLYILWNQGDEFWNKNVFARFYPEGDSDISEVIFMALALNRVDFMKSFHDSVIYNTLSKLTTSDMRFLYWYRKVECQANERTMLLHSIILQKQKPSTKRNDNLFIRSTFTTFFCNMARIGTSNILTVTIIDEVFRKLNNSTLQKVIVNFESNWYNHENIVITLYIWAVLNGMQDMALFLIDFVKQKCSTALIGAGLSETISSYQELPESLREVYRGMNRTFEDVAVNIVEQGFKIDPKLTEDLLTRKLDFVKGYTCIDFAFAAKQLKFISNPSVQSIFNQFWRGPWKYEFTLIDFVLTLLCPYYLTKFEYCYDNQLHELSLLVGEHIYTREELNLPPPPQKMHSRDKVELCYASLCDFAFKVYLYFKTPKVKFFWHMVSFIIFICLLSYSVLEEKDSSQILANEWILLTYVASMNTHEIKQFIHGPSKSVKQRFKSYFNNIWNKIDCLAITLFYIGFALQAFPSTKEYGHLLLCVDAYIWIVRSLRMLYFSRTMGPYVLMILIMFQDMMKFLVILFVFTIAHGVCFTAVMKPQTRSWNMLRDVVFHPYFNIYGELFFEGATNSTTIFGTEKRNEYANTLGLVMLAIYVLIANVLLLNLLIAIFGNTYSGVNDNAHRFWAFQRYELTIEYSQRSILVPPFSILSHLWSVIRWIIVRAYKDKHWYYDQIRIFKKELNPIRNLQVDMFETKIMKDFDNGTMATA